LSANKTDGSVHLIFFKLQKSEEILCQLQRPCWISSS